MRDEVEAVAFLAGSAARVAIMEQLRRHEGLTERQLRERVDCARTTVRRNLDRLAGRGWVRDDEREYALTTGGELVYDAFDSLLDTVETVSRLRPFLQHVQGDDLGVEVTAFRDAELTTGDAGNPLAMVNRHVRGLKGATEVRTVLPITGLHPYEVLHQRARRDTVDAECVVAPSVAETLRSDPEFADLTADLLDSDRFDLYVYDGAIPYYLGILDETVQLGVSEDGSPHALLETTSETVRNWAETEYGEYKAKSRKIS